MTTTITKDNLDRLIANVETLTGSRVLVGIPGDAPPRKDSKQPPNFVLGFINEFGDPARNIPARPFLIPGVRDAQSQIIARAKAGARAVLRLDTATPDTANVALNQMGGVAAFAVRARLVSGPFVPLANATLAARARQGRKGAIQELANRRAGLPPGTDLAKPLIDTGAMRQSVTHVIKKR